MAEETLVDGHPDPGPLHLTTVGLAPELPDELADLGDGLGRNGLPEAREAARGVDRHPAPQGGGPVAQQLLRLALAACVSFLSGLLFSWPSGTYRQPHQPITSTLPVQLFFWAVAGIAVLFLSSWYLATYPCSINISHDCNL